MRPRPSKHEVFTTCDFEGTPRVGLLVEGSRKDQRDMARREKVRGLRDRPVSSRECWLVTSGGEIGMTAGLTGSRPILRDPDSVPVLHTLPLGFGTADDSRGLHYSIFLFLAPGQTGVC